MTKIDWVISPDGKLGRTWNPITGCTPISPGCENCYAKRFAERLQKNPKTDKYRNGFDVTIHLNEMNKPYQWRKPSTVFVCSMGDLFHEKVDDAVIKKIITDARSCSNHKFLFLTKRIERALEFDWYFEECKNLGIGVSVENDDYADRIKHLLKISTAMHFVSFEPLLGDVSSVNLDGIDWVIVGGETGPNARPMNPEWVCAIQRKCEEKQIPFFFKQWGGKSKKRIDIDGIIYHELPEFLMEES